MCFNEILQLQMLVVSLIFVLLGLAQAKNSNLQNWNWENLKPNSSVETRFKCEFPETYLISSFDSFLLCFVGCVFSFPSLYFCLCHVVELQLATHQTTRHMFYSFPFILAYYLVWKWACAFVWRKFFVIWSKLFISISFALRLRIGFLLFWAKLSLSDS